MEGTLFRDTNDEQYYFSPITNRIVPVPDDITEDQLTAEEGSFNFGYDKEEALDKVNNKLEILILEGTQNCNLRCDYCIYGGAYEGEREHQNIDMSPEIALKASKYFIDHSEATRPMRVVSFYGGEPLMNPETMKAVVDEFKGTPRLKFSISTNGVLLDRYVDFLQNNNFMVAVSLDGNKEIHDSQRRTGNGNGSFDKIMENIGKFSPKFVANKFSFSATLMHRDQLVPSYEFFAKEFPNNTFRIGFQKSQDLKEGEVVLPKEDDYDSFAEEYGKAIRNGGGNDVPQFLRFLFDQRLTRIYRRGREYCGEPINLRGTCVPTTRKLFVKPNGKFYICEKLGYNSFNVGNVDDGIDTKKVLKILDDSIETAEKHCSDCWATRICDSCLPYESTKQGEPCESRLVENCEGKRNVLKKSLGTYVSLYQSLGEKFVDHLKKIEL